MKKDFSLYLVTDEQACLGNNFFQVIEEAILGGVTVIQLREKDLPTGEFIAKALKVKEITSKYNIPLLINDRIDVALATDADGVHIGQKDMPYALVKRLLPENSIIGLSVESQENVIEAEHFDLDYIAVSPLFNTFTKNDTAEPWEIAGLEWVSKNSRHPVVVIGGLNDKNASMAMTHGASGIAVVSAICSQESPRAAAKTLFNIIHNQHNL